MRRKLAHCCTLTSTYCTRGGVDWGWLWCGGVTVQQIFGVEGRVECWDESSVSSQIPHLTDCLHRSLHLYPRKLSLCITSCHDFLKHCRTSKQMNMLTIGWANQIQWKNFLIHSASFSSELETHTIESFFSSFIQKLFCTLSAKHIILIQLI